MKLGLIGTGVQGQRYMETISKIEGVNLLTPANRHGSYAGIKCFKEWKDLVDLKPDGVIIAADPALSCGMIKYCNFLNIPVLAEKPVGLFLCDVQNLEKCKIPILVNYVNLYNPIYHAVKAAIKSPITRIISIGYNSGPFREYSSLYDYMPHDLSMCLDLCPGDYEIKSQKAISGANGGLLYKAHFTNKDVEIQILCGNGGSERQRKLAVFCKNGDQFIFDDTKNPNYKLPLQNVVNHFVDVVKGTKPNQSFDLTVNVHKMLFKLGKNYGK